MGRIVLVALLVFAVSLPGIAHGQDDNFELELGELDLEVIEEAGDDAVKVLTQGQVEARVEAIAVQQSGFAGLSRHRWVIILGLTAWSCVVLAVVTRWVRPKGKARLMLRLHKLFAYLALFVASVHGFIVLFL